MAVSSLERESTCIRQRGNISSNVVHRQSSTLEPQRGILSGHFCKYPAISRVIISYAENHSCKTLQLLYMISMELQKVRKEKRFFFLNFGIIQSPAHSTQVNQNHGRKVDFAFKF